MQVCYAQLGPLCWTTAYKFYIFATLVPMIWGLVAFTWYQGHKRRKEIQRLKEKLYERNGKIDSTDRSR